MFRSAVPLTLSLAFVLGCAAPSAAAREDVVRVYPLQAPIDRQAGGAVEVLAAVWSDGADVSPIVRDQVVEALRRAGVFSAVGSATDAGRYLVRVEMHRRDRTGAGAGEVEGAVSLLDRQRNEVTATFRIRTATSGDDPRRAARDFGQMVAGVLLEPVKRD